MAGKERDLHKPLHAMIRLVGIGALSSLFVIVAIIELPASLRALLSVILWLAGLLAFGRATRTAPKPAYESAFAANPIRPTQSLAEITHQLRTPVNLIVGFCETMLAPIHAHQQPLPASYRSDLEAVHRNAKYLQTAIENILDILKSGANIAVRSPIQEASEAPSRPSVQPSSGPSPLAVTGYPKNIIIYDDDSDVALIFGQYITQFNVRSAKSIREVEILCADDQSAAVLLTNEHTYSQIPEIAFIVHNRVPILSCAVQSERRPSDGRPNHAYLTKPITFQALSDAFERLRVPIQDVLIIDDNQDNVEMIARMIESMPQWHRIWKTYSGREGLALMYEQRPDAIILDLLLPDVDGLALTQYLRSDPRLASIPIVMVSAYHDPMALQLSTAGKIAIWQLAGFQPGELARHIETLITALNATI